MGPDLVIMPMTAKNVGHLVRERDIVLLADDNHAARARLDRHVATLRDATLISGGNVDELFLGLPCRLKFASVAIRVLRLDLAISADGDQTALGIRRHRLHHQTAAWNDGAGGCKQGQGLVACAGQLAAWVRLREHQGRDPL